MSNRPLAFVRSLMITYRVAKKKPKEREQRKAATNTSSGSSPGRR